MSGYVVEGLLGIRSGRPYAYSENYQHPWVDLGLPSDNSKTDGIVNMEQAFAEAIPLIAHTAIHRIVSLENTKTRQEQSNLHAALLFTSSLAPVTIRHPHDQIIFDRAGISEKDLQEPNMLLKIAVYAGLKWTIKYLSRATKLKSKAWEIENLGLMQDLTLQLTPERSMPSQFKVVKNGILTYK